MNIARLMLQEFHNNSDRDYDLTADFVPSTLKTGLQYIGMGYTSCFEPALLPMNARQSHSEMADIPFVDKGGYGASISTNIFHRLKIQFKVTYSISILVHITFFTEYNFID